MTSNAIRRAVPVMLLMAIGIYGCGQRPSRSTTTARDASKAETKAPVAQKDPSTPTEPKEPAAKQRGPALSELIEKVDDGVVLITVFDSDGAAVGQRSGFRIDRSGLVATNAHVISRAARDRFRLHRDA